MVETLVGLNVVNDESYQQYRRKMKPILLAMGGGFRYDFQISKVCEIDISDEYKAEINDSINRVFVIYFPDSNVQEKFFTNKNYLAIKNEYFEPAVESKTVIAQWNTE